MTPAEKVALFRSLFRGRDDVYPRLWQNARNGKKGYALACANEWVRPVCDKPRGKMRRVPESGVPDCHRRVILNHLRRGDVSKGDVLGVYPLLKDET
jgi:hypothetical protein